MRRSTTAIAGLAAALVASNAWWAYRLLDAGVTQTYQSASLEESQQALSQSLAVIKAMAASNYSQQAIIGAAEAAWPGDEPFEKDGYLWVGRLGLRFNAEGRLVEAVTGV